MTNLPFWEVSAPHRKNKRLQTTKLAPFPAARDISNHFATPDGAYDIGIVQGATPIGQFFLIPVGRVIRHFRPGGRRPLSGVGRGS